MPIEAIIPIVIGVLVATFINSRRKRKKDQGSNVIVVNSGGDDVVIGSGNKRRQSSGGSLFAKFIVFIISLVGGLFAGLAVIYAILEPAMQMYIDVDSPLAYITYLVCAGIIYAILKALFRL
ncbi:MAG TPA: hypothetical protein DIT67_02315 [Octadecabacter sp.]|nr:hypothetical protein [Octadecabacter sp.]